jgi:hypothetical protein
VWSGPSTRSQAARVCSCSEIASATGPASLFGYPTGLNAATGQPWSAAADGLRNITGRVNPNGTVTIWAIISTVSGGGDQGADPNKLVEITHPLNAARPATGESFRTIRTAGFGEVLCGVSLTPRIGDGGSAPPVRWRRAHPAFPAWLSACPAGGEFHLPNGPWCAWRPRPGATRPWPTGGDGAGADGTTAACRW